VLPTFLGVSSLTVGQLWTTIIGFTVLYGVLAVVEVMLMVHFIRKGPYPEEDGRPAYEPRSGAGADPLPAE
jgi:cytochrome d ubiquinol oxidase subunit I